VARMPKSVSIVPKRKTQPPSLRNRLVVALAYDGLCTFEFGVAVEIFGLERPEMGDDWYRFQIAAIEPGPLRAMGGFKVSADGGLSLVERAGTIIVPGWRGADNPVPAGVLKALQRAYKRGARLLSFCSGVFVLAATGLLDGKRATTHWRYCDRLVRAFPNIHVTPDVLYVDEGNILTAAGSAAGIDLSLHLIRRDWGASAANSVARRLVVPSHRDGGQAQYIEAPVPDAREGGRLGQVLELMRADPATDTTIVQLARKAGMSRRTFIRRFKASTGTSPGAWLTNARIARARELLKSSSYHIDDIAIASGFGSAAALRHHFRRQMKVSPSAYRRQFGESRYKVVARGRGRLRAGSDAGSRLGD
jgi:AraC family transcriptional regulator, transcriptional activator FtrA